MKAVAITILFMFMAFLVSGQELVKSKMLGDVEVKPPFFMGVEKAEVDLAKSTSIIDYLAHVVEYPDEDEQWYREGCVVVQFTVLTNGNLDNFIVINSVSNNIDEEVLEALKMTDGMWKPGQNNGIAVGMEKEVAVTFQMENSNHRKIAQSFFIKGCKKFLKDKHKRALQLFDHALVYQPYDESILLRHGLTQLAMGNKDGACKDLNRIKSLGGDLGSDYLENYCNAKEYAIKK
ncbi:TonB family protein [Labilibaculum sp.]|uniref:TonB family protein n=1 Tax=Labilibaculum sp. TaxID=2060723 RepID=UPI003569F6B8